MTFRTQTGSRLLGLVYMKMLRDPSAAAGGSGGGSGSGNGSGGGGGKGEGDGGDVLYSLLCIVDTASPHADDDIRKLNYVVRAIPS